MPFEAVITLLIVMLVFIVLFRGMKVVPQSNVFVIERFGKFTRTLDAGVELYRAVLVNENVMEKADKYTDENRSYKGLSHHKAVNHSMGKWVDEMVHTNGMESFWAMFKKGVHGTYHRMSKKHLHRYVNEFAERHNLRPLDTIMQMEQIADSMNGKRLRYKELVA